MSLNNYVVSLHVPPYDRETLIFRLIGMTPWRDMGPVKEAFPEEFKEWVDRNDAVGGILRSDFV